MTDRRMSQTDGAHHDEERQEPPRGKLLGLDVGLARIGVAVCDPLQLASRPVTVLERTSRRGDFETLARIVESEEAQAVICGLPLNMDGSEGEQARTVRKWALRLVHALRALMGRPIPIYFWDERLSTFAAGQIGVEGSAGVGEDAIAAAVILQSFLDEASAADAPDLGSIILADKQPAPDQAATRSVPDSEKGSASS